MGKKTGTPLIRSLFFILASVTYGISLFVYCMQWDIIYSELLFWSMHILSVISIAAVFYLCNDSIKKQWALVLCLLAACMPFIGIILCAIFLFVHPSSVSRRSNETQEVVIAPESRPLPSFNREHRKKIFSEKINIQSCIDVIFSKGNDKRKINVINSFSTPITSFEIMLLKHASRDPSSEVKIAAVATLKKIENPLLEHIQRWSSEAQKNGSDIDALMNMGKSCADYARLGFTDEMNNREYLKRARDAFQKVYELNPDITDVVIELSKVNYDLGEYERALEYITSYLFYVPDNEQAKVLKCEILFKQRRLKQLHEYVSKHYVSCR